MVHGEAEPFVVGSKSFTAVAINTAAKAGQWIKSKLGDINQRGDEVLLSRFGHRGG